MLKIKLVCDSSCEISPELAEMADITSVPLTMSIGDKTFVDDAELNVDEFVDYTNSSKFPAKSGCPSPAAYADAFNSPDPAFGITLSSALSGSYQSAVHGAELAGKDARVIDSKSASAGETLIAFKLCELAKVCDTVDEIERKVLEFVNNMKTYFIIENLDNFVKNGRINPVIGRAASLLRLRMIMGSDNGSIKQFGRSRSFEGAEEKLTELVERDRAGKSGGIAVISHCSNPEGAERVRAMAFKVGKFEKVFINKVRGLSSMYLNRGGVILAF